MSIKKFLIVSAVWLTAMCFVGCSSSGNGGGGQGGGKELFVEIHNSADYPIVVQIDGEERDTIVEPNATVNFPVYVEEGRAGRSLLGFAITVAVKAAVGQITDWVFTTVLPNALQIALGYSGVSLNILRGGNDIIDEAVGKWRGYDRENGCDVFISVNENRTGVEIVRCDGFIVHQGTFIWNFTLGMVNVISSSLGHGFFMYSGGSFTVYGISFTRISDAEWNSLR